jgi:hypothetical protein
MEFQKLTEKEEVIAANPPKADCFVDLPKTNRQKAWLSYKF